MPAGVEIRISESSFYETVFYSADLSGSGPGDKDKILKHFQSVAKKDFTIKEVPQTKRIGRSLVMCDPGYADELLSVG
jgi:hypothetical protein